MITIVKKCAILIATAAPAALALCMAAATHAQTDSDATLSLFESVERTSGADQAQTTGPINMSTSASGGPQFALIGTARFGERYRVSVRDSSGEAITVDAGAGGSAAIPGYPGFRVIQVQSRHVLLEQPSGSPCFEFSDQGVTCEGGNTRLALATAAPIEPPPAPENRRADDGDTQGAGEENGDDRPQNPFAAALRAARERDEPDAAASRAEAQRFRPRRIDPEDVPEGYRLVRTPFGDRVVPL
jgi:hypothetical protein